MASPNTRPSTSLTRAIEEFDPLSHPTSQQGGGLPDDPTSTTNSLSFKRRTASQGKGIRSGLLGNLLRSPSDDDQPDLVPQTPGSSSSRTQPPSHIDIPSSASTGGRARASSNALTFDSDEHDDDDGAGDGDRDGQLTPTSGIGGRWPGKGGAGGRGFSAPGRISFSQPMKPRKYSGMLSPAVPGSVAGSGRPPMDLSPGGGGAGPARPIVATPLPILPITVLCIAMFGEFLSASTSSPFLYFMIEDFGIGQGEGGGGEAAVGFWTGIVSSIFFLTQFLTSLLWVSVADKHGRRAVLFASLMGNAVTLVAFGTSKNIGTALAVRASMGLFNGAVGVARSAVQNITDPTNESQAFTLMGLAWGLGGIVGSIIGGLAENPVRNYPWLFGDSKFLAEYPYLLPCLISSTITFGGALLSLFLSPDGGPREGGIHLPTEKDVGRAATSIFYLPFRLFNTLLSFFRKSPRPSLDSHGSTGNVSLHQAESANVAPVAGAGSLGLDSRDTMSLTSGVNRYGSAFNGFTPMSVRRASKATGSAYGYDRPRRNTGISGHRVMSLGTSYRYAPDFEGELEPQSLNFAQRLLLANEPAVFSLSELWVANATRNDETMSIVQHDDVDESVFEHDDDEESRIGIDEEGEEPDFFGYGSGPPSMDDLRGAARQAEEDRGRDSVAASPAGRTSSPALAPPPVAGQTAVDRSLSREREPRIFSYPLAQRDRLRRASAASSLRPPTIFANTGLDPSSLGGGGGLASPGLFTPLSAARLAGVGGQEGPGESSFFSPMAAIPESGRSPSIIETPQAAEEMGEEEKPAPSLIMQLPLAMIAQYALVALHGTTCDQIFLSFLVTPIPSGGLGMKASDYAGLIAAMFFFQTVWQFQFYPNVVAPKGPLTHLAMFRLGLCLYIPVYLLFPELRGLLSEKTKAPTLWGMMVISAVRYLASTCAYTAVMVLINAMSPPHLVPLANGLAQSAVSLARFVGPILGGTLWSLSIVNGPNYYPWPFNYAAGFVAIGFLCFCGFLHSFRIH